MEKLTGNTNELLPNQGEPSSGVSAEMHQAGPPSYEHATGSGNIGWAPPTQAPASFSPPHQSPYNPNHQQQQYAPAPSASPAPNINISYPTQQGMPQVVQPSIVIIQQQTMPPLGADPVYVICPTCQSHKLTRIEHKPSAQTHLMAGLMCLVGLWCCVCLPYCVGGCMNANHYCGNCNSFLGTYGPPFLESRWSRW